MGLQGRNKVVHYWPSDSAGYLVLRCCSLHVNHGNCVKGLLPESDVSDVGYFVHEELKLLVNVVWQLLYDASLVDVSPVHICKF